MVIGFLITSIAGDIRGIDPGRPGVPLFGRKLYHLGIGPIDHNKYRVSVPLQRKAIVCSQSTHDLSLNYNNFIRSLSHTTFCGLVLDYDGTLCATKNRSVPLDHQIAGELIRLLRLSIPIGIATGRGSSVRQSLQNALPKSLWSRLIIGYYNGAECATLNNNLSPDNSSDTCPELDGISQSLNADKNVRSIALITIRRKQISLEPTHICNLDILWEYTGSLIARLGGNGINMVMSAHSIDILAPGVSKRNVVNAIKDLSLIAHRKPVLCIGDQGIWPGNDSDLLSENHSLSVDLVSSDPKTCWNLAPAGYRGPQATIFYLKKLVTRKGQFSFQLNKQRRK
jgi:hydroxymethylpyrimidine pyrophosphatase-like HAD family hydrolase